MIPGSFSKYLFAGALLTGLVALACAPATQAPPAQGQQQVQQATSQAPFPTQGQPKYGGVLTMTQTDDPPNFDLYSNSTTNMQKFTWAAYNNLVIFDPYDNSKFMPDVAERWEISKDGKEATFYIRKGMKFHNGSEMTAADVKFSLDWLRDPPKGVISTRRDNLEPIDRIETPDDYTVKLILKRPYAALFPMLAQGWMGLYSKSFVEPKGHKIMEKEIMGTGAFKFKEYVRGTSIEMVKNPDYWQKGVPYLDGLKVFFIPDRGTRFAALRTGQIHLQGVDVAEAEELKKTLAGQINIEEGTGIGWSTVNMNAKRRPFDDLRVRKALSLAVDRPGFIKVVQGGEGVIGGYVPPTSPFALPKEELMKLPGYGPDVEANRREAKRLLAEAGFPNGFETTFTVRKGSDDLAIYVQDQFKQVGVISTIKILDSGPVYDAAVNLDFNILPWGHGLALDDPDAHYTELYLCGAPRDYSGMCDKKVTELFDKQSVELDPAKRKPLVWDLERYAVPLGIKLVLSWSKFRTATWSYVKGFQEAGGGGGGGYNVRHYKQVWMDK